MRRLTRDGTAESISRDNILRRERRQGNINFACSADHEQDWQPYPVDHYPCYMCDHTTYTVAVFSLYGEDVVMESLWSGQGLLRERRCCARGWWMMAVITGLSQEIHGTSFYCLLVPQIMGILS